MDTMDSQNILRVFKKALDDDINYLTNLKIKKFLNCAHFGEGSGLYIAGYNTFKKAIEYFFKAQEVTNYFKLETFYYKKSVDSTRYDYAFYSDVLKSCFFIKTNHISFNFLCDKLYRNETTDNYFEQMLDLDKDFFDASEIVRNTKIMNEYTDIFVINEIIGDSEVNVFKIHQVSLLSFLLSFSNLNNEVADDFRAAAESYNKDINIIITSSFNDTLEKVASFKGSLLQQVFSPILPKYNEDQVRLVFDYFNKDYECSNSLIRFLSTYLYTYNIFKRYKTEFDLLDYTFITVPIFKLVEVLFCDLVNKKWPTKRIAPLHYKNGETIEQNNRNYFCLGNKSLTLGSLYLIFDCDDAEICDFIAKREVISNKIKPLLSRFISKSRNGFLHKDALKTKKRLKLSINDSLDSIFMLILFFKDTETKN